MEATIRPAATPDHRTLGFFPLSIATSLAAEGLCGIHPELPTPPKMPLKSYGELWVNLRTLIRNIVNALDKGMAESISAMEIFTILNDEMEIIPDVLKEYNGKPFKVTYYYSDYKDLQPNHPHATLRTNTTPKQLIFADHLYHVFKLMHQHRKESFLSFSDKITTNTTTNSLILTHIAYDLLAAKNFGSLSLLESHTGKIKGSAAYYSKYYGGKELSMIPFTEELLQVFGDTETFSPQDSRLRKAIVELATRRNWSSVTTRARIIDGIGELPNPAHILYMKQLYRLMV